MFLLIPALLLAMEVAKMASITVSPPQFTVGQTEAAPPPKDLRFSVMVRSDGFLAKVGKHGTADDAATEIAVGASGHDYAALEQLATELKALHHQESRVIVTAEQDITLDTIVNTMDALRGHECSLAGAAGLDAPDGCLFWDVVVEG